MSVHCCHPNVLSSRRVHALFPLPHVHPSTCTPLLVLRWCCVGVVQGEDEYLQYFPLLKSNEKLYAQDQIWKKICKDLRWEFIASV